MEHPMILDGQQDTIANTSGSKQTLRLGFVHHRCFSNKENKKVLLLITLP